MRSFAKSMLRFSLASGLFGAEQVAAVLSPSGAADRSTGSGSLDTLTWAAWSQLGELSQAAFQAGDDLQRDWADLFSATLRPARWRQAAEEMAFRSTDALRLASPGTEGGVARRELANKLEVYRLVKGVRARLGLPPRGRRFDLGRYVEAAYELDEYSALWAVEGLGHDYAGSFLHEEEPRGILRDPAFQKLPSTSLPMLHAGLGLAFAEHLLGTVSPSSPRREVRRMVERFVTLCRESSLPEHLDTALESLGLETRCFFPDLVPVVERELVEMGDSRLLGFYWHGVGRGIYFVPVSFVPGYSSIWPAIRMSQRESPHDLARHHSLAGVSYAFALVNMSDPAILESLLGHHGGELRGTAFADGLAASLSMRQEITPDAAVLRDFIAHRPAGSVEPLWQEMVRRPCVQGARRREGAVAGLYSSLASRRAEA